MKIKFTLLLTMLLLVGAGSAWADDVTISTKSDWSDFAKAVSNGTTYSGKTVKLAADLEMGSESNFASDYMVGNSETNSFQGTFDGQGHTIKITKTGVGGTSDFAPFRFIKNATIKNLITTGALDISSEGQKKVAGIVSMVYGTSYIQNCSSSMKLSRTSDGGATANGSDDATIGGIIAYVAPDASVTVTNVLFDGTIVANKGISGIIGYVKEGSSGTTTCTISNTLFAGVLSYTTESNIRNIYRKSSSTNITVTASSNVYRKTSYSSTDAGTEATASDLLNGELAYKLASADNTGNTLFWGQGNLNKSNIDAYPSLTSESKKKVVLTKISGANTQPYVNPGGAVPNPVRYGFTGFKLSSNDAYSLETMPEEGGTFVYGTTNPTELLTTKKMYCVTLPADAITLILPFSCTLPDGITAYDITYTSGDKVTATSVSSITANKPVLINGTKGTKYKFSTDTDASYSAASSTNGALTGVFVDQGASSGYNPIAYVPKDSYVLQNKNGNLGFYKVETDNTIKITSFRAYLTAPAKVKALSISFEDGNTTGIESVQDEELKANGSEIYYNLSGQRVANPTKGMYIVNGKKVIIK